jgi:RNAse (barnase) inhibitor barstar
MSNLFITNNLEQFKDYFITEIDGMKANTLRGFYEEMADALAFPEEFGFTLDSFDEMLNNLSWLEEKKIVVFVSNSENFIEKERNPNKIGTLLDLIDATCEDWKWDEDEARELVFAFSDSERIRQLLDKQMIGFSE